MSIESFLGGDLLLRAGFRSSGFETSVQAEAKAVGFPH